MSEGKKFKQAVKAASVFEKSLDLKALLCWKRINRALKGVHDAATAKELMYLKEDLAELHKHIKNHRLTGNMARTAGVDVERVLKDINFLEHYKPAKSSGQQKAA